MKKNKKLLIRILVAFAIFLVGIVLYKLTPLKSFGEVAEKWSFGDYRFYLFVLPFWRRTSSQATTSYTKRGATFFQADYWMKTF